MRSEAPLTRRARRAAQRRTRLRAASWGWGWVYPKSKTSWPLKKMVQVDLKRGAAVAGQGLRNRCERPAFGPQIPPTRSGEAKFIVASVRSVAAPGVVRGLGQVRCSAVCASRRSSLLVHNAPVSPLRTIPHLGVLASMETAPAPGHGLSFISLLRLAVYGWRYWPTEVTWVRPGSH